MQKILLFLGFVILVAPNMLAQGNTSSEKKDTLDPKTLATSTKSKDYDSFLKRTFDFETPVISCKELKKLQEGGEKIVVLDARDEHEFEVSHIRGARRIGWNDFSIERVWMIDRQATVVVYCGIGERSFRMGGQMKKMGFKKVHVLYGSITEWVNQGNSLIDDAGRSTKKIFLANKSYSKWLKGGRGVF